MYGPVYKYCSPKTLAGVARSRLLIPLRPPRRSEDLRQLGETHRQGRWLDRRTAFHPGGGNLTGRECHRGGAPGPLGQINRLCDRRACPAGSQWPRCQSRVVSVPGFPGEGPTVTSEAPRTHTSRGFVALWPTCPLCPGVATWETSETLSQPARAVVWVECRSGSPQWILGLISTCIPHFGPVHRPFTCPSLHRWTSVL